MWLRFLSENRAINIVEQLISDNVSDECFEEIYEQLSEIDMHHGAVELMYDNGKIKADDDLVYWAAETGSVSLIEKLLDNKELTLSDGYEDIIREAHYGGVGYLENGLSRDKHDTIIKLILQKMNIGDVDNFKEIIKPMLQSDNV